MADKDLTLQLKLAKDAVRQQLAEFGRDASSLIASDMSQFQAAESAKAAAARSALADRAAAELHARRLEIIAAQEADAPEGRGGNTGDLPEADR